MSSSPESYITQWFQQLKEFQKGCINTSATKLDLLAFAKAVCLNYLASAADQNNFLTAIAGSTGCDDFQLSDLSTYKTFKALLDNCHLLETEIYNYLQSHSDPAAQKLNSKDYYAASVSIAFPDGSKGKPWNDTLTGLMACMEPVCFTLAFRLDASATVDKAGATMGTLIKQIAGLG